MKLRAERKQDALLDGGHRYCGVAAAIVGGAIIGGVASNAAASKGAKASDRATDVQAQAQAQAREDQTPYREAGYLSLADMSKGIMPGGEFNRNFTLADYQADPGYGFRIQQGERGINRAATAAGARYSGATLRSLARFNSELGSQEYNNAYNRFQNDTSARFNRLASVAGLGQTATNQTTAAGLTSAAGQAQTIQNAGAARASGYMGMANAINGSMGSLVNNYQQQQYLRDMNGGLNYMPPPDYGSGGGRANDYSENMQLYGV